MEWLRYTQKELELINARLAAAEKVCEVAEEIAAGSYYTTKGNVAEHDAFCRECHHEWGTVHKDNCLTGMLIEAIAEYHYAKEDE